MEHVLKHLAVFGMVMFMFLSVLWRLGKSRSWELKVEEDFNAALQRLNIAQHDVLKDRWVRPGPQRQGQLHRILHDRQGRYFLFIQIEHSQGVLTPLGKAQALLAVKMNG